MESSNREIKHSPIEELEQPIGRILEQLKEPLEKDEYGLLVYDDTSGRIPGFIISHAINLYERDRNKPRIQRIGIRGLLTDMGLRRMQEEFKQKTDEIGFDPSKRALLITEFIGEGDHTKNFTELFQGERINFDIASVRIREEENAYRTRGIIAPSSRLFYGERNYNPPSIYDQPELSGLSRRPSYIAPPQQHTNLSMVNEARRDVITLAEKLVSKLK